MVKIVAALHTLDFVDNSVRMIIADWSPVNHVTGGGSHAGGGSRPPSSGLSMLQGVVQPPSPTPEPCLVALAYARPQTLTESGELADPYGPDRLVDVILTALPACRR